MPASRIFISYSHRGKGDMEHTPAADGGVAEELQRFLDEACEVANRRKRNR